MNLSSAVEQENLEIWEVNLSGRGIGVYRIMESYSNVK